MCDDLVDQVSLVELAWRRAGPVASPSSRSNSRGATSATRQHSRTGNPSAFRALIQRYRLTGRTPSPRRPLLFSAGRAPGAAAVLPSQPGDLRAFGAGEALAFTAFDPLLAHPVAEGLLDNAEFSGHLGDGAVLVNAPTPPRRDGTPSDSDFGGRPAALTLYS